MTNLVVHARFNESKHQMYTEEMVDGLAPSTNPAGTEIALIIKNATAAFNQVSLKSRFFDAIDYTRDNNVLNDIAAGLYVGNSHIQIAFDVTGAVTFALVPDGTPAWSVAPENSMSVNIPVASGWAKDGSTVYLTNVGKRLFEKARETFLVYL
jgi:hypothetical protein